MTMLSDKAKELLNRWITDTPPEEPEPASDAEEWYAENMADAIGDERWIQELEERTRGQE